MTTYRGEADRVVYLAYGSNTDPERFASYIAGSDETSPYGAHRGSGDRTPVRMLGAGWVAGRLRFGGHSRRWGGGVALADCSHTGADLFAVRYELSRRQLVDLVSQENRDADVAVDWDRLGRKGRCRVTDGMYDTLVRRGQDDELLITGGEAQPSRAPVLRYLEILRSGLSRHLHAGVVERYLGAAVGGGTLGNI